MTVTAAYGLPSAPSSARRWARLGFWVEDPAAAFADFADWRRLIEGKTIVGALLGGLAGVEIAKYAIGARGSSGDAFVLPLIVGIAIGRVGCFLAGLADHTCGNPTALPWGVDFGDGIARHPTQLYEAIFVLLLACAISLAAARRAWPVGARFRLYFAGYFAFRFAVEFLKPREIPLAGLSAIQLASLAGAVLALSSLRRLDPHSAIATPQSSKWTAPISTPS